MLNKFCDVTDLIYSTLIAVPQFIATTANATEALGVSTVADIGPTATVSECLCQPWISWKQQAKNDVSLTGP